MPTVKQPVYKYNGIQYRGFTHAEEKILLQIKEEKNVSTQYENIKMILNQCTFNKVDAFDPIDFEMLFIKIMAKSSGEIQKVKYRCKGSVTDENGEVQDCGNEFFVTINLDQIVVVPGEVTSDQIKLDDELTLKLKRASIDELLLAGNDESRQLIAYMDSVFDSEEVYKFSDMQDDEIDVFVDSIPTIKKKDIYSFIKNQPKTEYKIKEKCEKCGKEHNIALSGLNDFFG